MLQLIDNHLIGIIIIVTLSTTLLHDLGILPGKLAFLLLIVVPQGRLFTRMGDMKKMGKSAWKYFFINEFLVFLLLVMTVAFLSQ